MNLFDLDGQTALVTGGGTGLGKQIAKTLSRAGAPVVLCARRTEKLVETAEEINSSGGEAICISTDVTDAESVGKTFDEACNGRNLSILVNNAGVASREMLLDLGESSWDLVLDTNLKGAWMVAREFARRRIASDRAGSIINIASALGIMVQKSTGSYPVSKAGLIHLTKHLAVEWARYGIRVNAIAPGYFASDMADGFLESEAGKAMIKRIPQRRFGQEGDFDGALLLLASDASRYMTGTVIPVDGGHSINVI